MTVLPQPKPVAASSVHTSETHVSWDFIQRSPEGRCEPSVLSILADSNGSVVASVTTIHGHSVRKVFTTAFDQLTTTNGGVVRSWIHNGERILRVAIDPSGHTTAIRSGIPTILNLPGGTYSLRRNLTSS